MKNFILATLICLGAGLSCTTGDAKPLGKVLANTGLSPDDLTIMGDQAATLYASGSPRKGATTKWHNDESGSHGVVELVGMQKNCALLRHMIYAKGTTTGREVRLRRCKTSDGEWILQ